MKSLTRWGRRPLSTENKQRGVDPFSALQTEINRVFDSFTRHVLEPWSPFGEPSSGSAFWPQVDLIEGDKEVQVVAELPGLDEKNVSVSVSDGVLTIQGEKKSEAERSEKGFHRIERSFGSFHRQIELPAGVESAGAKAAFKNGVLTVTLPWAAAESKDVKRIPIKSASG